MYKKLPDVLIASLKNVKGFDEENFLLAHQEAASVTSVRYNPLKLPFILQPDLPANKVQWCPYGFYLNERPNFTQDPIFHAGAYYVQEASSMFVWQVLEQYFSKDEKIKALDLCAAPGGKSTLLASYFNNGLIVCNEVIKARAAVLLENTVKWGSGNMVVSNNDPKQFARLEGYFDLLLIDAPCSGSGLFRKDVEAVNEWSEENVALCNARQKRILADALPALKENGVLIYSTCSYSGEENEQIGEWLLQNFSLESIRMPLCEGVVETEFLNGFGYRFYPGKIKGEGFYLSVFRKKETGSFTGFAKQKLTPASKQEMAVLSEWLTTEAHDFFKQNEKIFAVHKDWSSDLSILQQHLYLRKAGTTIGAVKGKDLIPAHDLATSVLPLSEKIQKVALDKTDALQYLKRKEIERKIVQKGWTIFSYNGLNLGWAKILPNRMNNYYPMEWRILKERL
ncbi:MAG: RNA methyltransferase [Chitinophagaceae bacterium]|nr:RNA methyltransferase [Chitinophagaceae bacterium]